MGTNIGIGNYVGKNKPQGSSFHPSLVDYWNFAGKKNSDTDRAVIKGIKGNILNAYNFGWSLSSGYGIYNTNFNTQWNDINSSCGKIINSNLIKTYKVGSGLYVAAYYDSRNFLGNIKGKITGMPEGYSLYIGVSTTLYLVTSNNGYFIINKNDIPVLILDDGTLRYNGGFKIMKTGNLGGGQEVPCDVTIELIPEYEGAIVTDGIDDYLKLDKVGYKIGTVIIKAIPLTVNENSYVFDVERKRTYFSYLLNTDNTIRSVSSFNSKRVYGNYDVLRYNDNNIANIYTPMFIGCRFNINEYISMALYEIAVYQDILTEE
jgi:hypothetical protein